MSFRVDNEWGELKQVIVGHGRNMHAPTSAEDAFDPTSFLHLYSGTYPVMDEVVLQLDGLAEVLANFGVEVLRPHDVPDLEQVFARDVGFVVEDQFFRSAMIENREAEWQGVSPLIPEASVRSMPQHIRAEGGDVLLLDDAIAVGVTVQADQLHLQTARTHADAVDFLQSVFPHREVMGLELHKHDRDPMRCALHLDCAFMPLGHGEAIVCREAFLNGRQRDDLLSRFKGTVDITLQEAALLQSNLLHLTPDTLLIDPRYQRLSQVLREMGYELVEVPMHHVGKMGGLFRCATLPLLRH